MSADQSWKDWCKHDGFAKLQTHARVPPASSLHARTEASYVPGRDGGKSAHMAAGAPALVRTHQRTVSSTAAGSVPAPYNLRTDSMREYRPPAHVKPYTRDPNKYDPTAGGGTSAWAPYSANVAGSQRAVYDPVSHETSLYTFSDSSVARQEGRGDHLMRKKAAEDLLKGRVWHGRRKGVVEFVDRTQTFAVNQNDAFLDTVKRDPHAYHTKIGENAMWMDNAFRSKMKVPFYGKRPYEMNR